jgi:hypothetical protein
VLDTIRESEPAVRGIAGGSSRPLLGRAEGAIIRPVYPGKRLEPHPQMLGALQWIPAVVRRKFKLGGGFPHGHDL